MKARLALVLLASLGAAACRGADDITPAAPGDMSAAGQQDLLTLVPTPSLDRAQSGRLGAVQVRPTSAEVHLARIAAAPASMLRLGSVVRLGLAPGLQVVADGQNAVQRSANDISWSGPIRGGHGWVQAVLMNGELTATVTIGETKYAIEPVGNGLHAVTKIDQAGFPSEHTPDNPSGALISNTLDRAVGAIQASRSDAVSAAALSTINVMVVYTASAATRAGNITSKIQLAVDETNQSYANSGISINFNRVYTGQVTYTENGTFSQHVSRLMGTTDGYMDNVHSLRNTYAADLVMLVVNDTEACGQAAAINATATSAFAVADQSCITGYYSFAHELGHLQGARHDRFVDGTLTPYQYGHGFIPSTKNWRTIMAYGNNCANCTRIQWWSNPLKTYPSTGQVMGTATYEDNARVLNLTAPTVAAFR
ncbi:MAG TPA: M12 family metallo-peptidase [Longimicrobium sp.]